MKLIPEWRKAWRMVSMQAQAIGLALCATYAQMYDQLKEAFPPMWMACITGAIFAFGMFGRLVKQDKVSGNDS